LVNLAAAGQAVRFTRQYLERYAGSFDRVYYFSYASEAPPSNAPWTLVPNRYGVHRWLYAPLLPFLEARRFRECDVLRVMQLTGEVPAIIARVLYGIPFVATYGYDYVAHARGDGAGRLRQWLFGIRASIALRSATAVIVTNPQIAKTAERLIGAERVMQIPNGVDLSRFVPRVASVQPHDPARVLFVGRLSRSKNLDMLLDALALLDRPCVLRLVGDGPENVRIGELARTRGVSIELSGVVPNDDLPSHFAWSDVFVLPSSFEGHPKALIEAMACGCVCVGTDVPGIRDVLTHDQNGWLAQPTIPSLAAMIRRALESGADRTRVSLTAASFAAEHYDIDRLLRREVRALKAIARDGIKGLASVC
jgi:glycosyltransferase involved in cell wall biosynthesis